MDGEVTGGRGDHRKAYLAERQRLNLLTPRGRAQKLCADARYRSSRRGLAYGLDTADIAARIAKGVCEATGLPLSLHPHAHLRRSPWAPSLDRIDNGRGYEADNVRVVCSAINVARNELDEPSLLLLAFAVVERHRDRGRIS